MWGLSCTDTRNWSQKDCHSRMFPLKVGTSNLGSLTPEPSLVTGDAVGSFGVGFAVCRSCLTRSEHSKIPFSRRASTPISVSESSSPKTKGLSRISAKSRRRSATFSWWSWSLHASPASPGRETTASLTARRSLSIRSSFRD